MNNVVRTAYQALAAVLGGTQSLHTNAYDEALGLPTEASAMLALRTQQILAYESGAAGTVDPLAGSYYVESLTDGIEAEAVALLDRIEGLGGAVAAIEAGFPQREIEDAAYAYARAVDDGGITVVGVNRYVVGDGDDPAPMVVDPAVERDQVEALSERRARRDAQAVARALSIITRTAEGEANLLYPMKAALELGATVGEVTRALLPVFGRYRPSF